ncbi:FkbM family methyltransferase [Vulcanisaeta thermophila]|uniref:FkbM family methyltransferase n=1 Tax=Vulcanisaeta thermophila TaxID=867917 RepID=UPI000853E3FF|nr:FkbM family methyltransferase [Vulcanisaeta thermophila]
MRSGGFLNVKGRVVIDVGAYIGDMPIYFIMKGAREVLAYEPHPRLYAYLIRNIEVNNLRGVIKAYNLAVWSEDGEVGLDDSNYLMLAKTREGGMLKVRSIKLPLMGDVLKMDCEGCEYDVLLSIDPAKLPFKEIGLEYHGSLKPIVRHLMRGGYKVNVVRGGRVGLIHAYRVNAS